MLGARSPEPAAARLSSGEAPGLVFDATRLVQRVRRPAATGIDRVLLEQARHFVARPRTAFGVWVGDELRVLPRPAVSALIGSLSRRWCGFRSGGAREAWLAGAIAELDQRVTGKLARKAALDALLLRVTRPLSLAEVAPGPVVYLNASHRRLADLPRLRERFGPGRLKTAILLHDLMPLTHAEYFGEGVRAEFDRGLHAVARHADVVLSVSEVTRAQLGRWAHRAGHRLPRVETVGLGADHCAGGKTPAAGAAPHFVCIGTLGAHKNVDLLLAVWRRLEQQAANAPLLHIVGAVDERAAPAQSLRRALHGLRRVRVHTRLNDARLERLVRPARALLAPSRAEGFGLPVLEALACGVPVIASDLEAHREVGMGVPEHLAPDDVEGWLDAVRHYAAPDGARRRAQLERLSRVELPRWATHFERLERVMRRLFDARVPAAPAAREVASASL